MTISILLYGNADFDRGGKARWLLREMGVSYQDHWLDDKKRESKGPAFRKLHPMGKVPVAKIGDQIMFESGAICGYLADLFMDRGFAPALSAPERARYQQWMFFASASIDAIQGRMDLIDDIPKGEVHNQKVKAIQEELRGALDALDQGLGKKNSFLLASGFTAADICVSYQLYWLRFAPELKTVMDGFARVRDYIDRMFARPAAQTQSWPKSPA